MRLNALVLREKKIATIACEHRNGFISTLFTRYEIRYASKHADLERGKLCEAPDSTSTEQGQFKYVMLCNFELA